MNTTAIAAFMRQPSTVLGISTLLGTATALATGTMSLPVAVPAIVGALFAIAIRDNTGKETPQQAAARHSVENAAETLVVAAQAVVAKPAAPPVTVVAAPVAVAETAPASK